MKLVIDANIGLKAMLPEQNSGKAIQLREDFRKGVHDLLAPDLYPVEVGNALVIAARTGRIKVAELPSLYADLMANLPIVYQCLSLFPRAYSIASQTRVSVYDGLYLALAEREGCQLLTDDVKLINAAAGFSVVPLSAL